MNEDFKIEKDVKQIAVGLSFLVGKMIVMNTPDGVVVTKITGILAPKTDDVYATLWFDNGTTINVQKVNEFNEMFILENGEMNSIYSAIMVED